MIGIIDYDTGNIRSVENALKRLGADYVLTDSVPVLETCQRLILPGVGEAAFAMKKLRDRELDGFLRSCTKPVLGICLGMQLLCAHSEEGDVDCLGVFDNMVRRFPESQSAGAASAGETAEIAAPRLKIPQVGWNDIRSLEPELYAGVPEGSFVYFVHSYYAEINENTASVTEYGIPFSSSLRQGNFMGCQFHPEKSGDVGEKIIRNFLEI